MPKKPNLAEAFKVEANELQPKPELQVVETQPTVGVASPTPKKAPVKRHIGGLFYQRCLYTGENPRCGDGDDHARDVSRGAERAFSDA